MSNLSLARNGGPRLHWSDPTPAQVEEQRRLALIEAARVAQAEASGVTGDGIPLLCVKSEPSDIAGCAEYTEVIGPPRGWAEFTRWRENGREVRIYKRG